MSGDKWRWRIEMENGELRKGNCVITFFLMIWWLRKEGQGNRPFLAERLEKFCIDISLCLTDEKDIERW